MRDLEERDDPVLWQTLSALGKSPAAGPDVSVRPRSIPPLPSLEKALAGLSREDLAEALAEPPPEGLPELRRRWREWQRRGVDPAVPSSLPLVTAGLSHGLSLLADLFGGEGRAVAVPQPFWGNYRQAFAVRTGAVLRTAPAYVEGRFNPRAIAEALAGLPAGEPALGLLNIPSNPGGYSPTDEERQVLRESLVGEAGRRPLVVVCDDAYAGLVFEPGISRASLFWELIGAHPNLIPVKVDGATKELSFFGGRAGFLTFGVEPGSDVARSLEGKVAERVRAGIGSAAASSQVFVLQALRREGIEDEVEAVRRLLEERYRSLRDASASADPGLLTFLPFNSGCFALVELPERLGLDSETVRRHLLEHHSTGLISIASRYLRIAHCSVDAAALPELVRRLERGTAELA